MSIAPNGDETIYSVTSNFGRNGNAWREAHGAFKVVRDKTAKLLTVHRICFSGGMPAATNWRLESTRRASWLPSNCPATPGPF
jgi:protocatechuate 3,4-dioxygenase beta subunit